MKWILKFLSYIYAFLNFLNKKLYALGILKTEKLTLPVLSVGNLTAGGSGKTPVMIYLVHLFQAQNYKIGVVSKNYKSKVKGIAKIDPDLHEADYYGDEPFLINQKTHCLGYVGPVKSKSAMAMIRNEKVDFVFVDDGFQHHALFKNCNILLMDATQWENPIRLLPWGRYRDDLTEIKKAHILVWTKTNLVTQEKFMEMKRAIHFSGPQFEFEFITNLYQHVHLNTLHSLQEIPKRVVLFCGLANPQPLIDTLKKQKPDLEIITKIFPDHYQYQESDLKTILDKPLNYKFFLTTEKDWVKIRKFWPKEQDLGVVQLDLKLNKEDKELYEVISGFLH